MSCVPNEDIGNEGKNLIGKRVVNRAIRKVVPDTRKTFHSFRKNFTQELYANDIDELITKVLIGHSTNKDITFSTYNLQKVKDEVLIEAVGKLGFEV